MTKKTARERRESAHPSVDPLDRLRIIIGLIHGSLTSWKPDNPKHRNKRDEYRAEAEEAYWLTCRRRLTPEEMDAIEDRIEAIARWRNRIRDYI